MFNYKTTSRWVSGVKHAGLLNYASSIFVCVLTVLIDVNVVFAQSVRDDIPGAKDIAFLKRYEDSYITDYRSAHQSNYRVIKGALEKVNGVWKGEVESHASGFLTQITYSIPEGYSTTQVHSFYLEQLEALQAEELFRCKGRSCGSSIEWANGVFGVRRISGPDRDQEYRLSAIKHDGKNYLLALYITRRANGRVYAHVDLLLLDKPAADFQASHPIRIMVLPVDDTGTVKVTDVSRLNAFIRNNPSVKLRLVGHVYGTAQSSVEDLLQRSAEFASKLKAELKQDNIIDAYGIGPLAPENSAQPKTDRIEVLRIE